MLPHHFGPHSHPCSALVICGKSWKTLCPFLDAVPSASALDFCVSILSARIYFQTIFFSPSFHPFLPNRVSVLLTVHAPCIHGSPSICMGNVFFVVIMTSEHCANRRPDARKPVRTCPMCKQFSKPITSNRLSPISEETTRWTHKKQKEKKKRNQIHVKTKLGN